MSTCRSNLILLRPAQSNVGERVPHAIVLLAWDPRWCPGEYVKSAASQDAEMGACSSCATVGVEEGALYVAAVEASASVM